MLVNFSVVKAKERTITLSYHTLCLRSFKVGSMTANVDRSFMEKFHFCVICDHDIKRRLYNTDPCWSRALTRPRKAPEKNRYAMEKNF